MFLAIINDTYVDVKTEIAIAPNQMQMSEYVKIGFYNMLRKCGCKPKAPPKTQNEHDATIKQIRNALKQYEY